MIGLSIAMNHCGVLRKMTGFFERQRMRILMLQAAARDDIAGLDQRLDHRLVGVALLALVIDDALAREARRSVGERAVFIDGVRDGRVDAARFERARDCAVQISKSSRPWPGAVCTKPVPVSSVTWSPASSGTMKS